MSQNAINGGIWGIFTTIIWISQHLQRPIYVWSTTSVWIMMKCGEEYDSTLLMHLIFGIQHFELIQIMISCNLGNENLQMEVESKERMSFKDLTYKKENIDCDEIPLDLCTC